MEGGPATSAAETHGAAPEAARTTKYLRRISSGHPTLYATPLPRQWILARSAKRRHLLVHVAVGGVHQPSGRKVTVGPYVSQITEFTLRVLKDAESPLTKSEIESLVRAELDRDSPRRGCGDE